MCSNQLNNCTKYDMFNLVYNTFDRNSTWLKKKKTMILKCGKISSISIKIIIVLW